MNIVDHLTTPGTYVITPRDERARVLSFNATTNEVEVTVSFGPEPLMLGRHQNDAFEDSMRAKGVWRSYHFKNLRIAPTLEGAS